MEKANYTSEDIRLKTEGLNLKIDSEVLDDQRALEVSTEIPEKEKVSKEDNVDFENFKVLYADAIKDKCIEDFGSADDEKLLEDTAKEMFLASKTYIPEEDKKADGEIEKKTESKLLERETKQNIYDEISRVLTDYENGNTDQEELYNTLVKVQNRWEDTITVCESKENKKITEEENPFKVKYKAMLGDKELKKGDKIKDFRGEEHIFDGITNPGTPFGGQNGKVCVKDGEYSMEYYPDVFNIKIVKVEDDKIEESIEDEIIVFDKVLSVEDKDGDTIMEFKVSADGKLYDFENCEIADIDDKIRIQQVDTFGYELDESKECPKQD